MSRGSRLLWLPSTPSPLAEDPGLVPALGEGLLGDPQPTLCGRIAGNQPQVLPQHRGGRWAPVTPPSRFLELLG